MPAHAILRVRLVFALISTTTSTCRATSRQLGIPGSDVNLEVGSGMQAE